MDDASLIQNLRDEAGRFGYHPLDRRSDLMRRAADRLERLRAEIEAEELRRDRRVRAEGPLGRS